MSLSVEGIRGLMRRCDGLPDNMSETEIRHYAAEVLRLLERGEDIETLELYLRRIDTSISREIPVSTATHKLAVQAFALFNNAR
jgi:hypothetical protein